MYRSLRVAAIGIVGVSFAALPVLLPAAASADPHPWQQPSFTAGDQEVNSRYVPKAQIEDEERFAPSSQASGGHFIPKAQLEYEERVGTQGKSGPSDRVGTTDASRPAPADDSGPAYVPWALFGILGLGAASAAIGMKVHRGGQWRTPGQIAG